MPEDLVPIGTFARAARLTVKTLRHYHDVGVLTPARVDPATSYRSYRWDQLADALTVTTLRELDVPLLTIREHLGEGVPLAEVLGRERLRLERLRSRTERSLAMVDALLAGQPAAGPATPEVVDLPATPVRTLRGEAHADTLDRDAAALVASLLAAAEADGLDTAPPVIGEYPWDLAGTLAIAVHLPVALPVAGDDARHELAGGRFARLVHTGPYGSVRLTYYALVRWIVEQGREPTGRVLERYVDDPGATPAHLLRTELLHPLS